MISKSKLDDIKLGRLENRVFMGDLDLLIELAERHVKVSSHQIESVRADDNE